MGRPSARPCSSYLLDPCATLRPEKGGPMTHLLLCIAVTRQHYSQRSRAHVPPHALHSNPEIPDSIPGDNTLAKCLLR
eukprot:scaffold119514_cov18-Tisochrysis_lutea.AAC.1